MQHPYILEVENLFKNKPMDGEIAYDGKTVFPLYQFANIVQKKDIYYEEGHRTVKRVFDKPNHKSTLEKYGIYQIRTKRGAFVPAMTLPGLKEFLSTMPGDLADKQRAYNNQISTLVESSDPSITRLMEANAVSSSVYLAQSRNAVAQERASAGASIAAPPEQVLAVRRVYSCACVTLFDHGPALQAPVAEDCTAVALRLPGVCILSAEQAQIFLETKKIEAEKMESEENKAERAHVMQKKNLEHGLQMMIKQQDVLDRESKRAQKDLDKQAARERQKLQIEKAHELAMMEKQWDLQNRDATAMNAPPMPAAKRRKSKPATESNARMVPLAIYKRSNTTTPLTAQQKLYKSNKAKQERLDAKAYRASLGSD